MIASPTMTITSLPKDFLKGNTIYYIKSSHSIYLYEPVAFSSGTANIYDDKGLTLSNDIFSPFLLTLDISREPATWTPTHMGSNVMSSSLGPSNPPKCNKKKQWKNTSSHPPRPLRIMSCMNYQLDGHSSENRPLLPFEHPPSPCNSVTCTPLHSSSHSQDNFHLLRGNHRPRAPQWASTPVPYQNSTRTN